MFPLGAGPPEDAPVAFLQHVEEHSTEDDQAEYDVLRVTLYAGEVECPFPERRALEAARD